MLGILHLAPKIPKRFAGFSSQDKSLPAAFAAAHQKDEEDFT